MKNLSDGARTLLNRVRTAHADHRWAGYVEHEVRVGAPLSYVAEKLQHTLEGIHDVYRNISEGVPDDLTSALAWPRAPADFSAKQDGLLGPLSYALTQALKAYAALSNANVWTPDLWVDVVLLTHDEFHLWLEAVAYPERLSRIDLPTD